jgi:archaellum component FlaF (FlaF/FlaG flagellin family)
MHVFTLRPAALTLSFLAAFLYVLAPFSVAVAAEDPTTEVTHEALDYYVPEKRITLSAEVEDETGVDLVRCYFKNDLQAEYTFVPMQYAGDGQYRAELPAPSSATSSLEYLFLVVNGQNVVYKTQSFTVPKDENEDMPEWQTVPGEDQLTVYSEVPQTAEVPPGFSDNVAMDVVESGARFGMVVGGLYAVDKIAAAGVTGSAASATAGGAVAATAAVSTTAIVAGSVAAAAVVGGAAAGAGGGSSSSSSSSSTPSPTPTSGGLSDVTVSTRSITLTVTDNGAEDGDQIDLILNGSYVLSNHTLTNSGTSVNVTMNSGDNTLQVHADNQGSSGLNTAQLDISNVTSGDSSQSWDLSTGETASLTVTAP